MSDNPKEIFRCHYPGCTRTFVRQDLCNRHQERHFARGREELAASSPQQSATNVNNNASEQDEISALVALGFSNASAQRARTVPAERSSFLSPKESETSDDEINRLLTTDHIDPSGLPGDGTKFTSSKQYSPPKRHSVAVSPDHRTRDAPQPSFSMHRRSTDGSFSGRRSMVNPADPTLQSPLSVRDEFAGWLFDDFNTLSNAFPGGVGFASTEDGFGNQVYPNYFDDPSIDQFYAFPTVSPEVPTDVASTLPFLSTNADLLSSKNRDAVLSFLELRFIEDDTPGMSKLREDVLEGDRDQDTHVLSMWSLQNYIGSYWYHFHDQLPILHQPTFSADEVHPCLLLAIMAMGASYLEQAHGRRTTNNAARFAAFVAWHLRWQVFRDPDSRPPAKLWVFQTLILLGIYEKMNSSRALHERAHIHSATTTILMRRGTALIDEHPTQRETSSQATSPSQWWSRWIQAEATRRAAFAVFYLDALSAIQFGHAALMGVHEIRLPLPCDDALWSATSAEEVGRVEASLHANGVQPTTFTDALRKTPYRPQSPHQSVRPHHSDGWPAERELAHATTRPPNGSPRRIKKHTQHPRQLARLPLQILRLLEERLRRLSRSHATCRAALANHIRQQQRHRARQPQDSHHPLASGPHAHARRLPRLSDLCRREK